MNTEKRKTILAGGGLVENEIGEFLFMYRKGKWDLPKGKLDPGETLQECALREVREETGVDNLVVLEFLIITRHEYEERGMLLLKESHWFRMKARGVQQLVPQIEEEITELRWIAPQGISVVLQNTYPNIVEVLKKAGIIGATVK